MKRKEIKWRREGRRVMTGRQDGVIFRIWTPYDAPEKGYSVSSNDTKGRGRGINTADHKTFPTWEAAVEATPWVWRLHQADMCAAWVDEREAAEE